MLVYKFWFEKAHWDHAWEIQPSHMRGSQHNISTILNASDGETTIGIQYESGRVVISPFNSYWYYLCTHSLSCKIMDKISTIQEPVA